MHRPVGSIASPACKDLATEWLDKFPLSTQGRHVVDRHGKRFKLAGVNWYGASDAYHVVGGLDVQSLPQICAAVRELGFSVVRLPFSNEMLRAREPTAGPSGSRRSGVSRFRPGPWLLSVDVFAPGWRQQML